MNFNINKLMKQANEMQKNMTVMREKIEETEFKGMAVGNKVEVTISGSGALKGIKIDPAILTDADTETIEDAILVAYNDAKKKADEYSESLMSGAMGGMNIPGLKLPF